MIGEIELTVSESHTASAVLDEGKPGTIFCHFNGNPIQITWSKVGKNKLPRRRVVPSGDTLTFKKVVKKDAGEYICVAFDGYNTVTASVTVTIDGKQ